MNVNNQDNFEYDSLAIKEIPEPSLRRLPKYLHTLKLMHFKGRDFVSCTHLSQNINVDPTLVRKDLSFTGIKGKPKSGYSVEGLICAIETFLNLNNNKEAFIVGAGNLGTALMGYGGFEPYGLKIVAAFDNNPEKLGSKIHGIHVLDIEKLVTLAKRMNIHIGIITVPAMYAQEIANKMAEGGIKAIWNFSPAEIKTSDEVIVINENLASSLAVLSYKIK